MLATLHCITLVQTLTPPLVRTTLGPVQGYTETAKSGKKVNVFRGVPFAATTGGSNEHDSADADAKRKTAASSSSSNSRPRGRQITSLII